MEEAADNGMKIPTQGEEAAKAKEEEKDTVKEATEEDLVQEDKINPKSAAEVQLFLLNNQLAEDSQKVELFKIELNNSGRLSSWLRETWL